MMHPSHSNSHRTGIRSQSLLLLCGWLSIPLGLGALSFNQRAQAVDLESPAITEVTPSAPVAPPADTFIDPVEPAWEPELAPPAVSVPVAPEPIAQPETIAQPEAPIVATPQSAPVVSPQMMPQVAESGDANQPTENSYLAPGTYDLGQTASTSPSDQSDKTVLTGSVSGCQASLNIDPILAATLCGPPVVQTAQRSVAPTPQAAPVTASTSYAYAYQQPEQAAPTGTAYAASSAPTPWVTDAPKSKNLLASRSPVLTSLPPSPNPLKWLIPNKQRMIFPLPMPVSITSAFGWRTHPISGTKRFHSGTDLGAPLGTPVLAAFPGQVDTAGYMGGYGLAILLQHQKGQLATRYAHLSKIYVQPGQWVSQGTIIGLVGNTGNSTGPHLHFETLVKKNNGLAAIDSGLQLKVSLAELIKAMQTAKVPPQPQG